MPGLSHTYLCPAQPPSTWAVNSGSGWLMEFRNFREAPGIDPRGRRQTSTSGDRRRGPDPGVGQCHVHLPPPSLETLLVTASIFRPRGGGSSRSSGSYQRWADMPWPNGSLTGGSGGSRGVCGDKLRQAPRLGTQRPLSCANSPAARGCSAWAGTYD